MAAHNWNVERGQWKQQKALYAQLKALVDSGDGFSARKVFESDTEMDVINKEIELINHYGIDNLFNGVSSKLFGAVSSEKALAVRQAISRARMGMKFSDEHRKNIGLAQKGRIQTPEWIKNNADARRGQKRAPYTNKLSPEASREAHLARYGRYYQKTRLNQLAQKKAQNDAARLQQWQSKSPGQPLPSRITPIAHLTPEQRQERKRARERTNHALRKARAAGDKAEIDRLTAERQKLDTGLAESIVSAMLDSNEELLNQMGHVAGRPASLLKRFENAYFSTEGDRQKCITSAFIAAGLDNAEGVADFVDRTYLDGVDYSSDLDSVMAEIRGFLEEGAKSDSHLDSDTIWALLGLFKKVIENTVNASSEDYGLPLRYQYHFPESIVSGLLDL